MGDARPWARQNPFNDFYDLWVLTRTYTLDDDRLARAIRATFERRNTEIPAEPPDALTRAFADDPLTRQQWTALWNTLRPTRSISASA